MKLGEIVSGTVGQIERFMKQNQLSVFEIDGVEYFVNEELHKIARLFVVEDREVLLVVDNSDIYASTEEETLFCNSYTSKKISRAEYIESKQPLIFKLLSHGSILRASRDFENFFTNKSKVIRKDKLNYKNIELFKKVSA